jgi:hypothetical protein
MNLLRVLLTVLLLIAVGSAYGDSSKNTDKYYYLTINAWTGDTALEACADGYHLASAFELLQVSSLTYNPHLGFTNDDSGYGPPAEVRGWMRTGRTSSPSNENCRNWTSGDDEDWGLAAFLMPGHPNGWQHYDENCLNGARAWCVSDPIVSKKLAVGSAFGRGPSQKHTGKYFYVTPDIWMGWEVHEACADGYHFASAFELLQVSNLTYNPQLGSTAEDSGYGPPAGVYGWLRTGLDTAAPGDEFENCRNWTSMGAEDFGLVGSLDREYLSSNGWWYIREQCIDGAPVWCVSDPAFPK